MLSSVPIVNALTVPNVTNPTISSKTESIMYDWKDGYNLKCKSRANFNEWLSYKQAAIGIEIQIAKTQYFKLQLYSLCMTLQCACNGTVGKSHYVKKTMYEQKTKSKQIEGGCPCFIQIKTYFHINTILDKYNSDHSYPISKNNLKYIQI